MKPPAFQFYADDFIGGTFTMSHEERGLYIMALCLQWTKGGLTAEDFTRLGSTVVQPSLNHVLTKFEQGQDGVYRNVRLEAERRKQTSYREAQSANGKASAQARFNGGSTKPQPSGQPKVNSPFPSPVSIIPPLSPDVAPILGGVQLSENQKAINTLFGRRDSTAWSDKERKALKSIEPIPPEDLALIVAYYTAKIPPDKDYRRRDLITLLNNWNGELDRARNYKPETNQSPYGHLKILG